jgi:hypothetical protein
VHLADDYRDGSRSGIEGLCRKGILKARGVVHGVEEMIFAALRMLNY